MAHPDSDDHLRRQLRTLQRVVGGPTDATLARRSGVAAATFSEAMAGKRRLRDEFVAKVIAGCVACARAAGRVALDKQHVLQALRLPGHTAADSGIFERDHDLNSCSSVLDGVRGRAGATIVVEGPARIGKSELLARVCAESAVRGITPWWYAATSATRRWRSAASGRCWAAVALTRAPRLAWDGRCERAHRPGLGSSGLLPAGGTGFARRREDGTLFPSMGIGRRERTVDEVSGV